jgi:hypothetical protein
MDPSMNDYPAPPDDTPADLVCCDLHQAEDRPAPYVCTRLKGHGEDHAAHGLVPLFGVIEISRWPRTEGK